MCSINSHVDQSKHSRKKKSPCTKETYIPSISTFYAYLLYNMCYLRYPKCCLCSLLHLIVVIIYLDIRQCAAWSSTLITHNFPERRKPRKHKETHAPSLPLPSVPTFGLSTPFLSLLLTSHYVLRCTRYFYSCIQAPSPRHRCGPVISSPSAPYLRYLVGRQA